MNKYSKRYKIKWFMSKMLRLYAELPGWHMEVSEKVHRLMRTDMKIPILYMT